MKLKTVDIWVKNASCQYKSDYVYKHSVQDKTCKQAKLDFLAANKYVAENRVKCNFSRD